MKMKKILIIEDEKNIVTSLKMYLEHSGYEVEVADNGLDGIKKGQEISPDLILLDLVLPRVNGYTVCKSLKETSGTKNIPLIIMSARTSKEDVEKVFASGADNYLAKPFSVKQISDIIKKYLGE
jgi:DNA-binding response OmpR family regulator